MAESKLGTYMPLLQQLTKYAFFLLCLFIFAPRIITLLDVTEQRMLSGGEISIGPTGIKLGEAPKMPVPQDVSRDISRISRKPPVRGVTPRLSSSGGGGGHDPIEQWSPDGAAVKGMGDISVLSMDDIYHLVHGAARQGTDYSVKVTLGAIEPSLLDDVEKVVYHLHETFKDSDREVTDRSDDFAIMFSAWGQFEIKADVYLKHSSTPIKLRRWLNF